MRDLIVTDLRPELKAITAPIGCGMLDTIAAQNCAQKP